MNRVRRQYLIWAVLLILAGVLAGFGQEKGFLLRWLAMNRMPVWDYYFYYITQLGEPIGFTLVGVILWLSSWRKMIFVPILGVLATLFAYGLKNIFEHERPWHYLQRIGWEGPMHVLGYHIHTGHQSFPSGHSMAAWALFTYFALMVGRPWVNALCLLLAVSVSISRVYLMVHFPQDVVAGAAIGIALGVGAYYQHMRWTKGGDGRAGGDSPAT